MIMMVSNYKRSGWPPLHHFDHKVHSRWMDTASTMLGIYSGNSTCCDISRPKCSSIRISGCALRQRAFLFIFNETAHLRTHLITHLRRRFSTLTSSSTSQGPTAHSKYIQSFKTSLKHSKALVCPETALGARPSSQSPSDRIPWTLGQQKQKPFKHSHQPSHPT